MKNDLKEGTKVAFIDSGIGGLVFAVEAINAMRKLVNHNLSFVHIGDTKNVPYGLKTPEQLVHLITNLIEISMSLGARIIVVACNTAGTVLGDDFIKKYESIGIKIMLIINDSANFLHVNSPIVAGEKHIAILGTKQTISSRKYEIALKWIGKNTGEITCVHQYSPIRWEQEVENGIEKNSIQKMVNEDLDKFKESNADFEKITAVGLFCTHYPYLKQEIYNYFSTNTVIGSKIKLISQGEIFAQKILEITGKTEEGNKADSIESYITGSEIKPIQMAMENIYPHFPVQFHKI